MKHRAIILLSLCLWLMGINAAVASEIRFRTIQTKDGLSSNHVNAIFRDSRGFMWLGTSSGLNRYDGYSMRTFHSDRPDSTSLHDNYVQGIDEDPEGNLWIWAGDRYSVFDPRTERFHRIGDADVKALGLPLYPNIVKVDGHDMWLSARKEGLYRRTGGVTRRHIGPMEDSEFTDIAIDRRQNSLVAVTDDGVLHVINRDTGLPVVTTRLPHPHKVKATYSIFIDDSHRVWVYSVNGAEVFNPISEQWLDGDVGPSLAGRPVKAISQDGAGAIWIGYDNDGIEVIDRGGRSTFLTSDPDNQYSLGNNSVKCIYRDNEDGMWVGTYKKGVSVYYPSEYKFSTVTIADVNCLTPIAGERGGVYLGTDHNGLMTYNLNTGAKGRVALAAATDGLAIVCLTYGVDGSLWIGTYNNGLYRYRDGHVGHISLSDGLASPNVWAIVANADGTIWLGTLGGGLQLYNPGNGDFRTFTRSNSGLSSDHINSMAAGKDGRIYIGTSEGVSILDTATCEITSMKGGDNASRRFGTLNVNQVTVDSRGLLWIGTREGLNVYDTHRDSLYEVTLRPDFNNLFIHGIIEDADRSMWVTSDGDLYNVSVDRDPTTGRYTFRSYGYGSDDGISGATFNQRSMCLLPSGRVLAGNLEGILVIDSDNLMYNIQAPRVKFTGLQFKNRMLRPGEEVGGRVILPEALQYLDGITLGHDQNDIAVYFATDSYHSYHRGEYEYMLEGFDDGWKRAQRGVHYVNYTNLPSGDYTLKVRLLVPGMASESTMGELHIKVETPWWWRWWMICVYVLMITAALVLAAVMIKRRERKMYLERQKEEQMRRNEEMNQLKFKFFTNISHDLRTPLTLILSPVDSLLKESDNERDTRRLTAIKRNAGRLLYLVNQLLDFRKNEMAGLQLNLSSGNLSEAVGKACENFMDLAERRGVGLEFHGSEGHDIAFDNDKITKAVMNLLSNAMKYTPEGGKITVTVSVADGFARITVADTGKGISKEDKDHIFERFYMSRQQPEAKTGTGIGLSLVAEYMRLHKGIATVDDNLPHGTVFTLEFPANLEAAAVTPHEENVGDSPSATPSGETAGDADGKPSPPDGADRPRVLFVDDNRDLTDFLREEFGGEFDVTCACDGQDALDKIAAQDFDLVVSDIMMPRVDGIKLGRMLKGNPRTADIPLIMLTAKQDVSSVVEGLTLGADDYVTKPFNNDVLMLKMRRLIRLRQKGLRRPPIDPTPSDIEITSLDEQLVEKAVKYVEDNISRSDLSVEELSRHLGMSRVHLYKKLLPLTGKTPIEFIRVLRLKRAAQYLRESQLNVSEIAYRLGFNNPKYFSRYFKDEFGLSPSEYQDREGK